MKIDAEKLKGMSAEEIQKYVYGVANRVAGKRQVRKDREATLEKLFSDTGVKATTMARAESYLLQYALNNIADFKTFVKAEADKRKNK